MHNSILLLVCLACLFLVSPINAARLSKNKLHKRQNGYPPGPPSPAGAQPDPGLAALFGIPAMVLEKTPAVPGAPSVSSVFSGGSGEEA